MNPSRLTLARKRRGLNKMTLARQVGITPKSLANYESGRACPPLSTLCALADVLRFPVAFFSMPDPEELAADGVSFRALKSMPAGQRDTALAGGALAGRPEQMDCQGLPATGCRPSRFARLRAGRSRASAAHGLGHRRAADRKYGSLARSQGDPRILPGERAKQVDAYSLWNEGTPFVFLNTMKTPEHGRMDAAHELGHLVLHRHGWTHRRGRDVERDAQQFGAAFLMPAASVRSVVPRIMAPTVPQLIQLKVNWKVSVGCACSSAVHAGSDVRMELPGREREVVPIRSDP